ncbi:alkaline serine exoprotease A-like [Patiria miniata]|uniref:Peptidase S8/S53 domain-containing protein n=1 Tax=Patiria miniata TaxID=46514 RepID=A0A914ARC6_PATMI|nr:alkaline serine exoprotease A-like [Patiria miniata]
MKVALVLLLAVGAVCAHAATLIDEDGVFDFKDQYIVKVRSSILMSNFYQRLKEISEELKTQSGGLYGKYVIVSNLLATPSMIIMKMDKQMLKMVLACPFVAYVEQDVYNDFDHIEMSAERGMPSTTWALDRINQVTAELDKDLSFPGDGAGVNIYVIDSGINPDHVDFEGRAVKVHDIFNQTGSDCCKHGTAVAGAAASKTWGVAKKANILSVRTLDCRCGAGTSHMAAAIDWVAEHAVPPCVATMSFSRKTSSPTICEAVQRLAEAGCVPVAAATNLKGSQTDVDACTRSPAKSPYAITAASTSWVEDKKSAFSRSGDCVDIFAPGEFVRTTAANGDYEWRSGTSMSVPLVAGIAAIHLGNGVPADQVRHRILSDALACMVADVGPGSPNRFLHIDPAPPATVDPEPASV